MFQGRINFPTRLKGVFWSRNLKDLDVNKDKDYIIHQLLMYGSLEDIKWLSSIYSDENIKKIFVNNPKKIYTQASFNFIKNYLLRISDRLNEFDYVKSVY